MSLSTSDARLLAASVALLIVVLVPFSFPDKPATFSCSTALLLTWPCCMAGLSTLLCSPACPALAAASTSSSWRSPKSLDVVPSSMPSWPDSSTPWLKPVSLLACHACAAAAVVWGWLYHTKLLLSNPAWQRPHVRWHPSLAAACWHNFSLFGACCTWAQCCSCTAEAHCEHGRAQHASKEALSWLTAHPDTAANAWQLRKAWYSTAHSTPHALHQRRVQRDAAQHSTSITLHSKLARMQELLAGQNSRARRGTAWNTSRSSSKMQLLKRTLGHHCDKCNYSSLRWCPSRRCCCHLPASGNSAPAPASPL